MPRMRPARPSHAARPAPAAPRERWRAPAAERVHAVAWAPDGAALVAGDLSGAVVVHAAGDGAARRVGAHDGAVAAVAWAADGAEMASAGEDGALRRWRPDGTAVGEFALGGWADRCAYSPDGAMLAGSAGRRLVIAGRDGAVHTDTTDHASTVTDLDWSPDGSRVATSAYGGVTLWAPGAADPAARLTWTGSSLTLRWSPDGRHIATGDQDATVHYWIVADADDLMMSGYPTKVTTLGWCADGRYLATGGGDAVTLWDCSGAGPAGRRPQVLDGDETLITAISSPAGGPLLAAGTEGGSVLVWRIGGRSPAPVRCELGAEVEALAFSPDGGALAAGVSDGVVVMDLRGTAPSPRG